MGIQTVRNLQKLSPVVLFHCMKTASRSGDGVGTPASSLYDEYASCR